MLGARAAGLFPNLLTSTLDPAFDLNVGNAHAGGIGLRVGFYWWGQAVALAVGYFVCLFRAFRGKVNLNADPHY